MIYNIQLFLFTLFIFIMLNRKIVSITAIILLIGTVFYYEAWNDYGKGLWFKTQSFCDGDYTTLCTSENVDSDWYCDRSLFRDNFDEFKNDWDCTHGCEPITQEVNWVMQLKGRDCSASATQTPPKTCYDRFWKEVIKNWSASCCSEDYQCGSTSKCLANTTYRECK